MVKGHAKKRPTCIHCKGRHTTSQHDHHGKGSFERFPSRKGKTKATKKLSKEAFKRRMNKGRKAVGLPPIPSKPRKKKAKRKR